MSDAPTRVETVVFPYCFAFVTDLSGFEWLDLAVLGGVFLLYLFLALIWPGLLLRPLWWIITHTIYRIRVYGREQIPARGPALIVCNHVSYIDWMLIWVACRRRVRFVIWAGFQHHWLLRLFIRITHSITIDGQAGPKAIIRSLRTIAEALDNGEVVCLFPEARLTRTGAMLPFHRGFERILKMTKQPVPVIPTCLSQIWGSIFSYRGGSVIWKWPQRIPYPVAVMFGAPMPSAVTAPEVRQRIQELSAETAIRENRRSRPVHRHFVRIAARFRQMFRPCFIDTTSATPRTLSYAKTLVGAICIARWLRNQLGPEQNVGVWLPSSVGSALTNIALPFLGKTSVNLNYTAGLETTRACIRQSKVTCVITSRRFLSRMPLDLGDETKLIYLEDAASAIGKWQRIRTFLMVFFLPGWFLEYLVLGLGRHKLDDIITIIFSSGSTGEPKGVMLSHANIAANIESFVGHIDLTSKDRILGVLPFFHSFGYTVTFWAPIQIAGSSVYFPDPRQAKEIGELARVHQCTVLLGTATFLRFYLRRCEPADFKTIRLIVCGAEKLPVALAKEFEEKFGVLPLEGYGCTETAPVISANKNDQDLQGLRQVGNKPGSVGQPVPGVAVRIVHPETDEPLPVHHDGMVWVKGANVMVGYLNKPEQTQKVIRDGWYVTGDMGHLDEDGFITITGRLSRFAKIGGEMVPLEKLEEEMHAVLGTNDRVLAVTAVPDPKRGERLVVLHLSTLSMPIDQLTTQLAQRGVPNLWIPSDRDFRLISEMPVLGSGKLDLRKLHDMAKQMMG